MTVEFTCDWCGEPIDHVAQAFAQVVVTVSRDGERSERHRDYHAGEPDEPHSCVARALRLLDGQPDSGLPTGWDEATRLGELDLPARVVRVLRGAGVETVAQLADRRALGGLEGVRGIGARALERIDAVLDHEEVRSHG